MFFPFGGGPHDHDDYDDMPAGRGGPVDNTKFYELLEVEKTATIVEIKKSYRRLAVQHHPDKGGDEAKVCHFFLPLPLALLCPLPSPLAV